MEFLDFLLDRQGDDHGDNAHDGGDTHAEPNSDSAEHDDPGGHAGSDSHNVTGSDSHENIHELNLCPSAETSCILQGLAKCGEGHDDICGRKFTFLIFPLLSLFIGTLAQPLSRVINISYTLVLLLVGIVLGILGCWVDMGLLTLSLQQWVHINPPTAFFYVFLAPLIFEAAFNTRWHVFKRLLIPILTAAFIIVTLQVGLIAAFQKLVIRTANWSWWAALMFGAMLSATDPISVTATLKSLGASEFLNTLIEGESLLNDGSAFVLWEAFFHNNVHPEDQLSVGAVIGSVFRLSLGGAAMGIAFGIVALLILGLVYDEFEVETSITVIVAFLGFWTAQAPSKLSGVICNVASGLVISAFGRHLITPAVRAPLAEFWELLSWIANTIVFVHAGVLLTGFIWSCAGEPNKWYDYLYIIVYYLYLQFIRMGLILMFLPIMRIRNKWFQWKEAFVVGFSGLRGAVSLVLALEVGGRHEIPDEVRTHVVIWATGIVGLSLLVNGFLIKPLVSALKLDKAKKTREDFLDRARALMVQKTLSILDSLAIENSFKCARWSYVRKMVLPHEWLSDSSHGAGYRDFVEQVLDNTNAARRKSLEVVRQDAQDKIIHSQIAHRMSVEFGTRSANATPHMSPRPTRYDYAADIARYSRSPGGMRAGGAPRISAGGGTLGPAAVNEVTSHTSPFAVPLATPISTRRVPSRFQEIPNLGEETLGPAAVGPDGASVDTRTIPVTPTMSGLQPLTLGPPSGMRTSTDIHRNRSIDADVERYGNFNRDKMPAQSHADIQRELAELHRSVASGEHDDLTEKDREVRRRLLTAILSHVRAISNTSLVEFSVLHNLEQDCQKALDANEEGHEYDLFSFLDDRGRPTRGPTGPVYNFAISLLEGKKLRGESAIITAFIVSGIMTEILKEDTLHESAIVQFQAEKLYQGASALLNRLETINPDAFEFVESQFAVYMCEDKQDGVLKDLHESGIVDDSEHKTLHHELIEVRRKYVHRRHSMFHRTRKLPARPSPRQLLTKHPLFVGMSKEQMRIVDRYGELVHLKAGQALQSERGSLVLVLQGSIRPLGESVLPPTVASHLRKSNLQVSLADESRSPMRKTVDSPGENAWNEAYKGDDPSGYGNGDNDNSSGNDGTATGTGTGTGNGHDEDMRKVIASQDRTAVVTPLGAGGEMYWSFPPHNAFCGPMVTLLSHVDSDGDPIKIAKERTMDTHFGCCEIAGKATVFTLPVNQVERLAKSSETFRMEITRSLARQIVLESVSDHRPYSLSQFADSVAGVLDVHTVAGRAIRVLERLPYMKVVPLRAGESAVHLQGPGVLLNGMVRVSIVDTSGLVGAINLLHEQLIGPALLPAGGLLIEEVHTAEDPTVINPDISQEGLGTTPGGGGAGTAGAGDVGIEKDARRAAAQILEEQQQRGPGQILAHVLIEEMVTTPAGVDKTAVLRLQRWTAEDELVDMNGRFGMNRHVELAPLSQVRIGK